MSNSIKTYCISLLGLVLALVLSRQAKAENLYNFPTHSKVKITRNPNGDSWLYLEFKWDEGCPPNFEKGKAIEFEIGILPKCFLRPKGGKDSEFDCNKIMGENGIYYNLPNEFIPDIGQDNCYVDLWNYWNPPASQVIDVLHAECDFDSSGDACASLATNIGAFLDKIGNFAVGLHDASTLQPGVMYSIRYPVEVNDSPACAGTMYETYANGNWCSSETPIWENRFSGYSTPGTYGASTTFYEGWGRAQVTMQTFKHSCDLPLPCDWVDKSYTCPHLIGAVDPNIGCIDAQKKPTSG